MHADNPKQLFWDLTDYARSLQENKTSISRVFEVLELAIYLKLREGYELQYWTEEFDNFQTPGFWQMSMVYHNDGPADSKPEISFILDGENLSIFYDSEEDMERLCQFCAKEPVSPVVDVDHLLKTVSSRLEEVIPLYRAKQKTRRDEVHRQFLAEKARRLMGAK